MTRYFDIPEPRLEPPENNEPVICSRCGQQIYQGEVYGIRGDETICPDCAEYELYRMPEKERNERIFEALGCDAYEVER